MRDKIPGLDAEAFNRRGAINTWPQTDRSGY